MGTNPNLVCWVDGTSKHRAAHTSPEQKPFLCEDELMQETKTSKAGSRGTYLVHSQYLEDEREDDDRNEQQRVQEQALVGVGALHLVALVEHAHRGIVGVCKAQGTQRLVLLEQTASARARGGGGKRKLRLVEGKRSLDVCGV